MTKSNVLMSLCLLTLIFCSRNAAAQQLPQLSPAASVSQIVGLTKISIDYSAPAVKGRTVWGDLIPYNKLWRAGANSPTKITFSTDVAINKTNVKAGTYSLFIKPMKDAPWTVYINNDPKNEGVFAYNDKEDVAVFEVKTTFVVETKERLNYTINTENENKGTIAMAWEHIKLAFEIETNTKAIAEANIQKMVAEADRSWQTYNNAARFYLENNQDLDKANEWIEKSIANKKYFANYWTKARLLAKKNNFDQALNTAYEALALGNENPNESFNNNKPLIEADIKAWTPNASKKWKAPLKR